jgi:RNA polymerase sigma-70 factor
MNAPDFDQFVERFSELIERLYAQSGAARWNLPSITFAAALFRSYAHRFGELTSASSAAERIVFLESLHIEDLALATACREGDDAAWANFMATYRTMIEAFARATINDPGGAQEVANSIWADLYGLGEKNGVRKSPLDSYHGRSSLKSWLRVVVVRREADVWRSSRKAVSLDGNGVAQHQKATIPDDTTSPDRHRLLPLLSEAVNAAISELDSEDKLRLCYYYVQELTLAEIAALVGEHESTVSRGLARARVKIRAVVERALRRTYHLSNDQINRCFEYAVEDWSFDLRRVLTDIK